MSLTIVLTTEAITWEEWRLLNNQLFHLLGAVLFGSVKYKLGGELNAADFVEWQVLKTVSQKPLLAVVDSDYVSNYEELINLDCFSGGVKQQQSFQIEDEDSTLFMYIFAFILSHAEQFSLLISTTHISANIMAKLDMALTKQRATLEDSRALTVCHQTMITQSGREYSKYYIATTKADQNEWLNSGLL